jgi:two-component system OmpR family response regulator
VTAAEPTNEAPRVLVVDDELNIAELVSMALRYEGFAVETAGTGRRALDLAAGFRPDVLILDVMLPFLDGWSVLDSIRDMPEDRQPKVILVSAAAGVADRAQAENLRVESFLAKPFDMDELLQVVADCVRPG